MTKTLEMWKVFANHTGKNAIVDYLIIGDILSTDLIDYIKLKLFTQIKVKSILLLKNNMTWGRIGDL